VVQSYAVDRDGQVDRVIFQANGETIGTVNRAPYTFTWRHAQPGCYDLTADAVDNQGNRSTSNTVRVNVGLRDLARGKPVTASSGETPEQAVDGNYYTAWKSGKSDAAWLMVDLGKPALLDKVNLLWGWKIHPASFTVDLALDDPSNDATWTTVYETRDRPYQTWEATDRITFTPHRARYARVSCRKRAGNQNWAGYQLTALEIPAE
jgi:hypothetical protein